MRPPVYPSAQKNHPGQETGVVVQFPAGRLLPQGCLKIRLGRDAAQLVEGRGVFDRHVATPGHLESHLVPLERLAGV